MVGTGVRLCTEDPLNSSPLNLEITPTTQFTMRMLHQQKVSKENTNRIHNKPCKCVMFNNDIDKHFREVTLNLIYFDHLINVR